MTEESRIFNRFNIMLPITGQIGILKKGRHFTDESQQKISILETRDLEYADQTKADIRWGSLMSWATMIR